MRILVTGGAGFVGARLVPVLAATGHDVTVLDAGIFPRGMAALTRLVPQARVIRGDLRDANQVRAALDGVDAVIGLAAMSNDPMADLRPELTKDINLTATLALIDASEKAGCRRFVNVSSASVYGVRPEGEEVHEEVQTVPQTLYAKCKLDTELYALDRHRADFEVVSVRPGTLSGWSPRARLDLTANIFTYQALATGEVRVFGGDQQRPNLHIDDLVSTLAALPTADGSVYGTTYNLNQANYTVRELAENVAAAVGAELGREIPITVVPSYDNRSYRLSNGRAQRVLGFRPRRSLTDAVEDVVHGIQAEGVETAGDPEFRNVAWLKELAW